MCPAKLLGVAKLSVWTVRFHSDTIRSFFIDKPPDAVNVWIGDSRSVTSIHSGNGFIFIA